MTELSNPRMHSVHFYKPRAKAIYCMALQPQINKLALSRSTGNVEVWNLDNNAFIERTIACSSENFSIEGLVWCGERLFSVGLHGMLVEYDLFKLNIKSKLLVTGNAAFCLDVNNKNDQIAIGTELGYLNIYNVAEDEVIFYKLLDKQEGRILCLKYDKSGEFVVSGSMDALRIWSVKTGHALHKMVTGRSEQNKPTIVWCLAITQDFSIISGDSRGVLTVWDGKLGAQIETYQSHKADILSITISDDEQNLYCSGIDPSIANYVRIDIKGGGYKWIRNIQRKIHNHDVRALLLHKKKLYSGGVDGYLACSYHAPKTLIKYPPILDQVCVLSHKARQILLIYPRHLEVWKLGVASHEKDKKINRFPVLEKPQKLAVVQKISKSDEGEEKKEGILCASMSHDGEFIFYSTHNSSRLLKLFHDGDDVKLALIEFLFENESSVNCVFTSDGFLVLAPHSGSIKVFKLGNDSPELVEKISTEHVLEDTIITLVSSHSGNYLVAADAKSNIAVWFKENNKFKFHCKLPNTKVLPTALAIHPIASNLVVAFSDNTIIEYDLKTKQYTKFSRFLSKNLPTSWRMKTSLFRNITFDPRTDNLFLLHNEEEIVVFNKDKKLKTTHKTAPKAMKSDAFEFYKTIRNNKHLVHLSWFGDDEMVSVEVNPLSLIEHLPPCKYLSSFGRK